MITDNLYYFNLKTMTMKSKVVILLLCLVFGIALTQGCFTQRDAAVSPPIPGLEVKPDIFKIDAEKGGTVEINSGTTITIPANSFMDTDGNIVKGEVDLHYRELHDAQSIYFSGVSMRYDSLEQAGHLQTAGMFEIQAYQNTNKLRLNAKAGGIDVNMASFETGNDYNFYRMNEENGNWEFKENVASTPNPEREKLLNEIQESVPKQKFPKDDDCFIFDYNTLLDIMVDDPRYKKNIKKAGGYGVVWSAISINEYAIFEGKKTHAALLVWKRIDGEPFPEWVSKRSRGKLLTKSENENKYKLTIKSVDKKSEYTATVEPLRKIKKMYAKKLEQLISEYEQKLAELSAKEKLAELTASVFRPYKVQEFGFYNWDKKFEPETEVMVVANFDFAGKKLASEQMLHYVLGENRSVVKYYVASNMDFRLIKDNDARIIAVLPDSTMAVFTPQQHSELDIEAYRTATTPPKVSFKMTIQPLPAEGVLANLK